MLHLHLWWISFFLGWLLLYNIAGLGSHVFVLSQTRAFGCFSCGVKKHFFLQNVEQKIEKSHHRPEHQGASTLEKLQMLMIQFWTQFKMMIIDRDSNWPQWRCLWRIRLPLEAQDLAQRLSPVWMGSQKGLGLYRNVYVYDQDQDLLDWVHKTSEAPEQHLKSTLYIKNYNMLV